MRRLDSYELRSCDVGLHFYRHAPRSTVAREIGRAVAALGAIAAWALVLWVWVG